MKSLRKTLKKQQKGWLLLLVAALFLMVAGGCSYGAAVTEQAKSLVQSLSGNIVVKVGSSYATKEEAGVFLLSEKKRMEAIYGSQLWSVSTGGKTVADCMDAELISFLTTMLTINELAQELGLSLNQTEEERIERAASEYYNALTSSDKSYLGISLDAIKQAFTHYYTMQLVIDYYAGEVETEISDDESRVITIQQIYVSDYETAQTVLTKAQSGTDFSQLSAVYNEASDFERQIGRGEVAEEYEAAVFSLASDSLSEVIAADGGYYIVKCISSYEVSETIANKSNIASQRVIAAFTAACEEFAATVKVTLNEKTLTLSFGDEYSLEGRSFYEVYELYFS